MQNHRASQMVGSLSLLIARNATHVAFRCLIQFFPLANSLLKFRNASRVMFRSSDIADVAF